MKKVFAAAALFFIAAGTAQAETALLPTQTLDPGQAEAEIDISFERWRPKLDGMRLKNERLESVLDLGFGVMKGLQVNASIPYVWKDRQKVYAEGEAAYLSDRDGIGDLTLGAIFSSGTRKTHLLSVSLDVKLDTAPVREGGEGKAAYMPQVGASIAAGDFIPYATYRATIRGKGDGANSHTFALGTEIEASEKVEFDVRALADIVEARAESDRYSLDLTAYLEITKHFYALPGVSIFYVTPSDVTMPDENVLRASDTVGFGAFFGLYWLF